MQKICCGDLVVVTTGKDRGKTGKVLSVERDALGNPRRLLVEGVKLVKKHKKANPQMEQAGEIVSQESPVHISNVAIYNSETGKRDKVQIKTLADGNRVRVYRSTQGEISRERI